MQRGTEEAEGGAATFLSGEGGAGGEKAASCISGSMVSR